MTRFQERQVINLWLQMVYTHTCPRVCSLSALADDMSHCHRPDLYRFLSVGDFTGSLKSPPNLHSAATNTVSRQLVLSTEFMHLDSIFPCGQEVVKKRTSKEMLLFAYVRVDRSGSFPRPEANLSLRNQSRFLPLVQK